MGHWYTSQWNLHQLSSAWSQLTNPSAKGFLRGLKNWSSKVPGEVCAMNSKTLPIHTAWTTVGCLGCVVSQSHGFLSSKNSSCSVQHVAAAQIVSHLGRKLALSKVSCWDSDKLPPCTCRFFVKRPDALVSHCEKHLETVIMLKSGVHVCVYYMQYYSGSLNPTSGKSLIIQNVRMSFYT